MNLSVAVLFFFIICAFLLSSSALVGAANITYFGQELTGTLTGTVAQEGSLPCEFRVSRCTTTDAFLQIKATLGDGCNLVISDNDFVNSRLQIHISTTVKGDAADIAIVVRDNNFNFTSTGITDDILTLGTPSPTSIGYVTGTTITSWVRFADNTFTLVDCANRAPGSSEPRFIALMRIGGVVRHFQAITISGNTATIGAALTTPPAETEPQWIFIRQHQTKHTLKSPQEYSVTNNHMTTHQYYRAAIFSIYPNPFQCDPCGPHHPFHMQRLVISDNELTFAASAPVGGGGIMVLPSPSEATEVPAVKVTGDFLMENNKVLGQLCPIQLQLVILDCVNCSATTLRLKGNSITTAGSDLAVGAVFALAALGDRSGVTLRAPNENSVYALTGTLNLDSNTIRIIGLCAGYVGGLVITNTAATLISLNQNSITTMATIDGASQTQPAGNNNAAVVCLLCVGVPRKNGGIAPVRTSTDDTVARASAIRLMQNYITSAFRNPSLSPSTNIVRVSAAIFIDSGLRVDQSMTVEVSTLRDTTAVAVPQPNPLQTVYDSISLLCVYCTSNSAPETDLRWSVVSSINAVSAGSSPNVTVSFIRAPINGRLPGPRLSSGKRNLFYKNRVAAPAGSFGIPESATVTTETPELKFAFASSGIIAGAGATQGIVATGNFSYYEPSDDAASCNRADVNGAGNIYLRREIVEAALGVAQGGGVGGVWPVEDHCGETTTTTTSTTSAEPTNSTTTTTSTTTSTTVTSTTTTVTSTTSTTSTTPAPPTRTRELTLTRSVPPPPPYVPPGLPAAQQLLLGGTTSVAGVAGALVSPSAAMSVSRGANVFALSGCPGRDPANGAPWIEAEIPFPHSLFPGVGAPVVAGPQDDNSHLHGNYARAAIFSFLALLLFALIAALCAGYFLFFGFASGCRNLCSTCSFFSLEWWTTLAGVSPVPHLIGLVTSQVAGFWLRHVGLLLGSVTHLRFFFLDAFFFSVLPVAFVGWCWSRYFRSYFGIVATAGLSTFGTTTSVVAETIDRRRERARRVEEELRALQEVELDKRARSVVEEKERVASAAAAPADAGEKEEEEKKEMESASESAAVVAAADGGEDESNKEEEGAVADSVGPPAAAAAGDSTPAAVTIADIEGEEEPAAAAADTTAVAVPSAEGEGDQQQKEEEEEKRNEEDEVVPNPERADDAADAMSPRAEEGEDAGSAPASDVAAAAAAPAASGDEQQQPTENDDDNNEDGEKKKKKDKKKRKDKKDKKSKSKSDADGGGDDGEQQQQQPETKDEPKRPKILIGKTPAQKLEEGLVAALTLPAEWQRMLLRILNSRAGRFCLVGDVCWDAGPVLASKQRVLLARSPSIIARVWGPEKEYSDKQLSNMLDKKQRKKIKQYIVDDVGHFRSVGGGGVIVHQHRFESSAGFCARIGCFEESRMRLAPHSFLISLVLVCISGFLTGIAQAAPETCPTVLYMLGFLNAISFTLTLWLRPFVIPLYNALSIFMDLVTMIASLMSMRQGAAAAGSSSDNSNAATIQMFVSLSLTVAALLLLFARGFRFVALILTGSIVQPLHVYEKGVHELLSMEKIRRERMREREQKFDEQQQKQQQQSPSSPSDENAGVAQADDDLVVPLLLSSDEQQKRREDADALGVEDEDESSLRNKMASAEAQEAEEEEHAELDAHTMRINELVAGSRSRETVQLRDWESRFDEIDRGMRVTNANKQQADDNDDDELEELVAHRRAHSHYRKELDSLFFDL